MATGNFYSHENGIFVLPSRSYEEAEQFLIEEHGEDEVNEDMIHSHISFEEEYIYKEFYEYMLKPLLEEQGIDLFIEDYRYATVERNGRMIAKLALEPGYYEGCQVIVETNPDELFSDTSELYYNERIEDFQDEIVRARLNEVYTTHNKTFFKVLGQVTDEYSVSARFSNGETMYSKVG